MDFTYTPRMAELKARAAELAGKIMVFEDECEQHNGLSDGVARHDPRGPSSRPGSTRSTTRPSGAAPG